MAVIGKIISMEGVANIISSKGESHAAIPGEQVQTGDTLQTPAGVTVKVQLENGRVIDVAAGQMLTFTPELTEAIAPDLSGGEVDVATIDSVIEAIENGEDINEVLEATAAGGAGGSDGRHSAVFLDRISLLLNPLALGQNNAANNAVNEEITDGALNPLLAEQFAPLPATAPIIVDTVTSGFADPNNPGELLGDQVFEGDADDPLVFQVGLNAETTEDTVVTLTFTDSENGVVGQDTSTTISVGFVGLDGALTDFTPVSSDGGVTTYTITVPAGTQDFVVVLPTTEDAVVEDAETITLTAATAANDAANTPAATGTILDDDVIVSNITSGVADPANPGEQLGDQVEEGDVNDPLLFQVDLNREVVNAAGEEVTLTFIGGTDDGTATFGTDTSTAILVSFAGGAFEAVEATPVTNGDTTTYTITVPVGVQSFVVNVPTTEDALIEDAENLLFTATTESNDATNTPDAVTGIILDNDTLIVVDTVTSGIADPDNPGERLGDEVIEGDVNDPLLFEVGLNAVTLDQESVTVTFANGSGEFGVDTATDITVDFGGGFVDVEPVIAAGENGTNYTFAVPAGVQTFVVSLPTVDDTTQEDSETISFTAATANNTDADQPAAVTGTIIDNDTPIFVTGVQAGTGEFDPSIPGGIDGSIVNEGDETDPLQFQVTLNAATPTGTTPVTLVFTDPVDGAVFGTDTTTQILVDFGEGPVLQEVVPVQEDGVSTYVINVPENVTSFVVNVPTTDDELVEEAEQVLFTASTDLNGVDGNPETPGNVTGTIIDDDTPIFVTGVQAGTGTFDPSIPGGVDGSIVNEGDVDDPLLFQVSLNEEVPFGGAEVTLTFTDPEDGGIFGTDTSTDILIDFQDGEGFVVVTATPTQVNGVTTYLIEVPQGAQGFVVNVPTTDDALLEDAEQILFTASTELNGVDGNPETPANATGTIIDNDTPIFVTGVQAGTGTFDPSIPGGVDGSIVNEGDVNDPLLFQVSLNEEVQFGGAEVTLTFTDPEDGGIFGTDTSTDILVDFGEGFVPVTATPVSADGVTTYLIEVPEGAQDFIVNVPTTDDALLEDAEQILFTASTELNGVDGNPETPANAAGTIIDNDTPIFVTGVQAGTGVFDPSIPGGINGSIVTEGDVNDPLQFEVDLNAAVPFGGTEVTLTFTDPIGGAEFGTDTSTDILVDFGDGFVEVTATPTQVNGVTTYVIDVPAGTTSFVVNVPTIFDGLDENAERILFTASTEQNGIDGNPTIPTNVAGTILDNALPEALGLNGEYYGYNDVNASVDDTVRSHADDDLANTSTQNLDSIADIEVIINGRQGSTIVGTSTQSNEGVADARFFASSVRYGLAEGASNDQTNVTVNDNLGTNQVQAAGETLSGDSRLATFLAGDAAGAVVEEGSANPTAAAGTTSGIGNTTDSIIRLTGSVFLERGNYDFRVFADDGFRLRLGGETLIEFDGNQSPTEHEFKNLSIENEQAGLTSIELIYWEQGQNAALHMEFKLSSEPEGAYRTFSNQNLPMYPEVIPIMLEPNQTIINAGTAEDPVWQLQTGSNISGEGPVSGTAVGDILTGNVNDDSLEGLAGADELNGGAGNDNLDGGDGNDILDGGTGADTLTGGLGDDLYRIDDAGDITIEADGEGTDTVELDASFNPGTYDIEDNFENLNALGDADLSTTGNALDNRIFTGAGDDTIDGQVGDDRINGGAGDDVLTGGDGKDVFEWSLSDKGATTAPAVDHITDFVYTGEGKISPNVNNSSAVERTDAIDLRDLLVGEVSTLGDANFETLIDIGNLQEYIEIEVVGGSTTININSTGNISAGADQQIVLDNVDLVSEVANTSVLAGATADILGGNQAELLKHLVANGTLIVD